MRTSNKNTALELVCTLLPPQSKYGLLIDLETCFDIKIDTNFNNGMRANKRLVGSINDLENNQSIANSVMLDEDFSPGNSGKNTATQSIKTRKTKNIFGISNASIDQQEIKTGGTASRNQLKRRNESYRTKGATSFS